MVVHFPGAEEEDVKRVPVIQMLDMQTTTREVTPEWLKWSKDYVEVKAKWEKMRKEGLEQDESEGG